ncbi:hypothetical protein SAMN04489713_103566 [Actinomadura madurae]|uniref:Uncharacterized protein n=1 Tax=Actinomadura madurae TaxID=1993 RepID=A0A1I5DB65_9ACTN|nr:hypothetical protein [Actinomadura madurae]SFN96460.1 hypothetical protein SAMN04489713_103566 [Actinomadura madurae]
MVRMLGAWGAALVVWLVGFTIVAQLASGASGGERLSDLDRTVRLDLPWVLISIAMVVAAGAVQRDRTHQVRWFAGILAIPVLAIVVGAAAPIGGDGDPLAVVLYVAEGVAGAAAGAAAAAVLSVKAEERGGGYW